MPSPSVIATQRTSPISIVTPTPTQASVTPVEVLADSEVAILAMGEDENRHQDNWRSESYQRAAAFVPELATKVVQWLDVQPDDVIMDIGCGDGFLTQRIASCLTTGLILGIDSSASMIETAAENRAASNHPLSYKVLNATKLLEMMPTHEATALTPEELEQCKGNGANELMPSTYTKVFSNAALHWILREPESRDDFFQAIFKLLQPGGHFVFEMGGHGNVAELRAALISAVAHRCGINAARVADPWFFPDEKWMRAILEKTGYVDVVTEMEYRPTKAEQGDGGGVEGWVRVMGKWFLAAVEEEKRGELVREVSEVLKTVCGTESGEELFGYVRLRVKAMKPM